MIIKPLLSICIPTYNRVNKLQKLIKSILESPLQNFEVIILDNCSTDGTMETLRQINDRRLFLHSNDTNVGGILNGYKVLMLGKGTFSLICLDKDWIDIKYLPEFISVLENNSNVNTGFCNSNITGKNVSKYYKAGIDAIVHLAYLSKHPSGIFYKTGKYKNLKLLDDVFSLYKEFPFSVELINAELANTGDGIMINIPLVITETFEESASIKSHTYNQNNLFFLPKQRVQEYCTYISHASKLSLPCEDKHYLINKLFNQGLRACTASYINIMNNKKLRDHYSLVNKKISIIDCIEFDFYFCKMFLDLKINMDFTNKFILIIYQNSSLFIQLLKRKAKALLDK